MHTTCTRLFVNAIKKPDIPSLRYCPLFSRKFLHGAFFQVQDRLFSCEKAQDPDCGAELGYNGRQSCSTDSHVHSKDKQGIQKDVQYCTDQYRKHSGVSKALAVYKRVHSQSDHHKQGSQKIDPYVVCRIGKSYITGAKSIEDRSVKDKADGCQDQLLCRSASQRCFP